MEGQHKSMMSNNGVVSEDGNNNIDENKRMKKIGKCECLLRVLGMVLSLSGAVILGVDKQTKVLPIQVLDNLPPMNLPVSAKWHHLSAFVYFVVANAIVASYAAISLVLSFATRRGKNSAPLLVFFVLDVVMTALLFSSNGAAAAIGLMGYEGNPHVKWDKVCNVFDKFCKQGAAAILVSSLGAFAFLLVIILAAKRLHHKSIN